MGIGFYFESKFHSLSRNDLEESTGATVAEVLENLSQLEMF